MRRIEDLEALDPTDPVQAQEGIDEAISANQHIQVQTLIEASRLAAMRTAISPNAIRLAKRS